MNTRHPWQIDSTDIEALVAEPTQSAAVSSEPGRSAASKRHELAEEPLFVIEARARAEKEGRSVEDVLAADVLDALNNEYPREGCLSPEQVAECVAGEANEEELRHLSECSDCRLIVELARPSTDRRGKFLDELARTTGTAGELSCSHRVQVGESMLRFTAAPLALLSSALACTFVAGVMTHWLYVSTIDGSKAVENVAVSPSGTDAVLAGNAGKSWLLDLAGERQPIEFKSVEESGLRFYTFTPDGNYVTASCPKGKIAVWSLDELEAGKKDEPTIYPSIKDWSAALEQKSADGAAP